MRTRAARFSIVVAFVAGAAMAGVAVQVGAMHPVLHDVSRAVAIPAHVAATVSPSRVPGGAAHLKAGADDAWVGLVGLLVLGVPVLLRRSRPAPMVARANSYVRGCRAPPSGRF